MATPQRFLQFRFQVTDASGIPLRFKYGVVPDLIFHVPPANFEVSGKKIPTREITKGGWYEAHGGDDLDIITASGGIGIMFTPGVGLVNLSQGSIDTSARIFLDDLIAVFKNNGNSYDSRGFIYQDNYVKLTFDRGVYKGLFENLSYSETVDKPYDREYNFSFIVQETSLQLIRPIGGNYGTFGGRKK